MIDLFNPAAWGTTATTNLISLVLVVVTGVYVLLTWRIANANKGMLENIREQYRESVRPVLFASVQVRQQVFLRLVNGNSGKSPAYRVRVQLDRDFHQFANPARNIRDFNIFNQEIAALGPGAEFPIDLAQGFNLDKEHEGQNLTPTSFTVTLSYASKDAQFEETVPIDLRPYFQTHHTKSATEWLQEIANQLEKISDKVPIDF